MRHGKKFNHLSRQTGHRKAMLANMACSLIEHKRINTTVAKAKALKQFFEPLVTKSKEDTTHNRRICFSYLRSKYAVTELFREVADKVADRPGGYTRIIKLGNRLGDNADMAMIELVDFNEFFDGFAKDKKKATTRRSRRSGSSATTTDAPATKTAAPKAAVVEEIQDAVVVEDVVETAAPVVETTTEETPTEETSSDETSTEETK